MAKNKLETDHYNKGHLVRILDRRYRLEVTGHLPEQFGISAGSDITSPFASYATEGTAAKLLALTSGISNKIGITTTKLFMGPDQPDLTLDLKFEAYYSARDEVVIPCLKLLMMSVGTERNLKEFVKNLFGTVGNIAAEFENIEASLVPDSAKAEDYADLIRYMRTPGTCRIYFGNVYTLDKVYLSNVNVNFSNVLDSEFMPMSADVSITITPESPLSKGSLLQTFGNAHDKAMDRNHKDAKEFENEEGYSGVR